METLNYKENDFYFVPIADASSKFDILLRNKWDLKMSKNDIFRYKLNIFKQKFVGQKLFLQLNTDRASLRRPPANITSFNEPFNAELFNFNKVKDEEKLFFLQNEDKIDKNELDDKNLIIVNISPLEYGHILLVPSPRKNLPQVLTEDALKLAVEISLLSSSRFFRVGFNSLCAFATVNHLHFHGYYLQQSMYLESVPVEEIAYPCYRISNFPGKGFVFQIKSKEDISFIVANIYRLVQLLQKNNMPHNLYITRGTAFETAGMCKENIQNKNCLRIYVWARKPNYGIKELSALNAATCELFGHVVIKNEEDYDTITEKNVSDILDHLTNEPFQSLVSDVKNLFI